MPAARQPVGLAEGVGRPGGTAGLVFGRDPGGAGRLEGAAEAVDGQAWFIDVGNGTVDGREVGVGAFNR